MKLSPFIENVILTTAMLVGLNYWVHAWHEPQRLEFINRLETERPIGTLILGDSTMASGLSTTIYQESWAEQGDGETSAYNAAIGNSTATAHYLALRKGVRHHPEIKRVIYGAIGFRLTDHAFGPREGVAQNVSLEYYQEPEISTAFHKEQRTFGDWKFTAERKIPMYVERHSFWVKVEKLRRKMDRIGLSHATTNEFGRTEDFRNFLHPDADQFVRHCEETASSFPGFWAPIEEMIQHCAEREIELTVVFMPMSHQQRDAFYNTPHWKRYIARVEQELADRNVRLIDATDWISEADEKAFPDNLHVAGEASNEFSRRLAKRMR